LLILISDAAGVAVVAAAEDAHAHLLMHGACGDNNDDACGTAVVAVVAAVA